MGTYDILRQFADSWALLAMTVFFLLVVARVLRPGARQAAQEAAAIPFDETTPRERAMRDRREGGWK